MSYRKRTARTRIPTGKVQFRAHVCRRSRPIIALIAVSLACAARGDTSATQAAAASPGSASQLLQIIQAFEGTWQLSEEFPPSAVYPQGGKGRGTEVWRAGPGNITLTYEYHAIHPDGEMWASATLWWDADAHRLRELWCSSAAAKGCVLSTAAIRWEDNQLIFTDSFISKDQLTYSREIWSHVTADAHTMTIFEGHSIDSIKPWIVARATKIQSR